MKQSAKHLLSLWSPVLQKFPFTAEIGHFGGYALLSLLLYRALAGGFRQWSTRAAVGAVLCAVLYGCSDELHQYFVPGREPAWSDVLVDGAGAAAAAGACRLIVYFREKLARARAEGRPVSHGEGEE